jgi:hypothetical protein
MTPAREETAKRDFDDYTIGEVLADIKRSDAALVLTGGGSILAYIGSAVLERLGMKPEGMAEVTATIDEVTEITIRWPVRTKDVTR